MSDSLWPPWTQAPLSMGFSRQEYWSGLPCLPLGDFANPGIKTSSLRSPALAGGIFLTSGVCNYLKHDNLSQLEDYTSPPYFHKAWSCGFLWSTDHEKTPCVLHPSGSFESHTWWAFCPFLSALRPVVSQMRAVPEAWVLQWRWWGVKKEVVHDRCLAWPRNKYLSM